MSALKTSLLFAGLLAMSAAQAQTAAMSKDQVDAAEERIEATAKADKAKCEPLKANQKDVCEAEAKAAEKVAKAELKFKETGKAGDRVKYEEMKAEAAYEVAKEKCEDLDGDRQSACKKDAKATEKAAREEAKKLASSKS